MSKKITQFNMASLLPSAWDKGELKRILKQCTGRMILVVGDVGLDRYTIGVVERISPEAPVPIVLVEEEKLKLGLAANVADNVRTLGGIPILVGVVGADRGAEDFRKLLKMAKISSTHLVEDSSRRTVLKERVVSDKQQLVRIDYESSHSIQKKQENEILRKIKQVISKVDAVVIEDYAKGVLTEGLVSAIVSLAYEANKPVAIDPNIKTPVEFYYGATLLTPNTREAEYLSGIKIEDAESLLAAGISILEQTSAKHVVITRGKDGMAIFTQGSSTIRLIPTYAQEVFDVSGAGDTVISVLALALSSGASIEDACILGNLAAGVEVGKRGTATVTPKEIQVALEFFSEA